jgi:glycosyltransferase involved in cell wall biosynthesis
MNEVTALKAMRVLPVPAERLRKRIKLIIQIPCFNEEQRLAHTLSQLPREVPGVDVVEWLVVNDGSTDRTVEVAKSCGVDHIVDLPFHMGLARGFMAGLERALEAGADIIVNTDADNQYDASAIPSLIEPILEHRAQFVLGERPIEDIASFSKLKRKLQRLGSGVVRMVSETAIMDAPSGFRALSREAALRLNVFDSYTYTLETLIEAGLTGIPVASVPVGVNDDPRPSRLVRSNFDYVKRSAAAILRAFLVYKPLKAFFLLGLVPLSASLVLIFRWMALRAVESGGTHVPSLVAAAILMTLAALLWMGGLLGELIGINRRLLEEVQYSLRRERAERVVARRTIFDDDYEQD